MTDTARLLFSIFASDILPIFVIAGLGFLLARLTIADVRPLSRVTFYALAPALVFNLLATSTLGGLDFGRMALFYALVAGAAGLLARLAAVPLKLDRPALSAFLLVVVCSNSGNFGLPLVLFAFGRDALTFASVYFIASATFSYTGGVLLAASGRRSLKQALAGVARVPAVYGAAAAALTRVLGVDMPDVVMRPVGLLSDAALPLMILVLGMQLERARMPERPIVVATAVGLSLIATPMAALAVAHLLQLEGPAFQAGMLQAAMPAAVITTILALEFDMDANFATSVVLVSTLLSPFTLTFLIAYLR